MGSISKEFLGVFIIYIVSHVLDNCIDILVWTCSVCLVLLDNV